MNNRKHGLDAVSYKKKMWVPKGSTQVQTKDSVQASIARTTPEANLKTKESRKQSQNHRFAHDNQNLWQPHLLCSLPVPSISSSRKLCPGMFDYSPWFWCDPWMPFYESLQFSQVLPRQGT